MDNILVFCFSYQVIKIGLCNKAIVICVICFEVSTLFLFQVSYEQTKRQIDRSHLYICKIRLTIAFALAHAKKV